MDQRQSANVDYLLSTRWLRSLAKNLDYRIRYLDGSHSDPLIRYSRSFLRNPAKIIPLLRWSRKAQRGDGKITPDPVITVEIPGRPYTERPDDEFEQRRRLKVEISRGHQQLNRLESGPVIRLAKRVKRLSRRRTGLLRLAFEAYKFAWFDVLNRLRGIPQPGEAPGVNVSLTTECFAVTTEPEVRVIGPDWLCDMLAFEGLPQLKTASTAPPTVVVCLGDNEADAAYADAVKELLDTVDVRTICWHYGSTLTPTQIEAARSSHAVFAADERIVQKLSGICRTEVSYLPPAVQPRIHNPIGDWDHYPCHEHKAECEPAIPEAWRRLIQAARGASPVDHVNGGDWMDDEILSAARRYTAVQQVLLNDTMRQRVQRLSRCLGTDLGAPEAPLFSALVATKRPRQIDHVLNTLRQQSYENLELILVLHGDEFDQYYIARQLDALQISGTYVHVPETRTLGECLRIGSERCSGHIIGKMDDDDMYGPNYISETVAMFECSDAAVVGKQLLFRCFTGPGCLKMTQGPELSYTAGGVAGATISFKKEVLCEVQWKPLNIAEDVGFYKDCIAKGIPLMTSSRFNFVSMRRENSDHTYHPTASKIAKHRRLPETADPYDLMIPKRALTAETIRSRIH